MWLCSCSDKSWTASSHFINKRTSIQRHQILKSIFFENASWITYIQIYVVLALVFWSWRLKAWITESPVGSMFICPLLYRDITLPTKVRLVKAMVFPVVMYGCESWTVNKAERQRIDAFELWCWRRLLRVPWTARRSNQSILKEINPGISLEGMMLKLKLQYFGHLMRRVDSLEKTDAGRDWGQEEKGTTEDEMDGWHYWLNGRGSEWTLGVGDGQGGLACCDSWGHKESNTTERLI